MKLPKKKPSDKKDALGGVESSAASVPRNQWWTWKQSNEAIKLTNSSGLVNFPHGLNILSLTRPRALLPFADNSNRGSNAVALNKPTSLPVFH